MFASPASFTDVTTAAAIAPTKKTKPCLKRQSSVPPVFICRQEGSCESLSSSFGSMASEDSTVSSGSRKSVVFADSVGEDLCRIKIFSKDLYENGLHRSNSAHFGTAGYEESWPARMWHWQQRMTPVSETDEELSAAAGSGMWFVGDESEDQEDMWYGTPEEEEDEEDEDFDFGAHSVVHEVLQEEDEDSLEEYENCKNVEIVKQQDPSTVITPTFISPMDLPEYDERLERLGLSLESGSVEATTVRGAVRAHQRLLSFNAAPAASMAVFVRYSRDSWQTTERVPALPSQDDAQLYEFHLDVTGMAVGDDVEMVVETDLVKEGEKGRIVDDNDGLKYRVICKSKAKFRPGKSLW